MSTTSFDFFTITGGKLRRSFIERPSDAAIMELATSATADGFGLAGDGPIKRVTGSKITIIVGPTGCTCSCWRNSIFCHHAALYLVETGRVSPDKRERHPLPLHRYRERRPYTRRPLRQVWPPRPTRALRPVIPFRRRRTA